MKVINTTVKCCDQCPYLSLSFPANICECKKTWMTLSWQMVKEEGIDPRCPLDDCKEVTNDNQV